MILQLKQWQINLILATLAKLPYEEVVVTIEDIKQQIANYNKTED